MSRISGLQRPRNAYPNDAGLLEGMLASLPGSEHATLCGGSCVLGRTSQPGETAIPGGAAEAFGLLVALDGRIVNGDTLRSTFGLTAKTDASLIAELVRIRGFEGALPCLAGDFAMAVCDPAENTMWLARDRFGVKPLYWANVPGGIAFASQPRGLLALPEVPADFNRGFVARFAATHYRTIDCLPEESPYAAIRQLPAAHFLEVQGGKPERIIRYWELSEATDWLEEEASLAERYRALLLQAVGRRVTGAHRPAFTLSGGLDSSSVLSCAVELTGTRQHAFSSVYVDATFDERHEIQDVVAEKVERWHTVELGDEIDIFTLVEKMVGVHDEPVVTATWLSHFVLCEQVAKGGFANLFGGLGGDELNAGEYEYFPLFFADLKSADRLERLVPEVAAWVAHHDHPIYRKDASIAEQMMSKLTDPAIPGRCLPDLARIRRYGDALNPDWFDLSDFKPIMEHPFSSYLKNRTWQDITRETLPCCLRAEDRHCTYFGIEHCDPFLDHDLVEFMYRVPGTMKIRDGVTKRLLRRAMQNVLPEKTRTRIKKTGWNAPAHRWFRGRTLAALRDRVASQAFHDRGVYDPTVVMRLIDEHEQIVACGANRENHMMFLWQLLNLDTWMESQAGAR